jgi:glycosyltransferase involved in cell wall biosynthesis
MRGTSNDRSSRLRAKPTRGGTAARPAERGSPLRIGLVSEFVYPFHKGGAEKRFYEVATRLVSRGHEVHWYGTKEWSAPAPYTFEGIRLHAAGKSVDVYRDDGSRSISATLRKSAELAASVARSRPLLDVLDCSLYPFFHVPAVRLLRPRVPLVVTWHEFWGSYWYELLGPLGFFGKATEAVTARLPRRIVAISDLAREGLLDAGVDPAHVSTVYNGVDSARIADIGVSSYASDIVFFGRLKNHKNVDLLLRAVAILRESHPDVRVLVLGDGPERERLHRLCADLDLGRNVEFRGALDEQEMLGLVAAARICVNPSTKEGGGSITLLEANAAGVPVVAIHHPLGIDSCLIEPGRTGWWAPDAEPESLAATLAHVLADGRPRDQVRAECQEFAQAFDWEHITDQYERVYRDVRHVDLEWRDRDRG